jgi:hypothetical protein
MINKKRNFFDRTSKLINLFAITFIFYYLNQDFQEIFGGVFEILLFLSVIYFITFSHLFLKKSLQEKLIVSLIDVFPVLLLLIVNNFQNLLIFQLDIFAFATSLLKLYFFASFAIASLNYLLHKAFLKLLPLMKKKFFKQKNKKSRK